MQSPKSIRNPGTDISVRGPALDATQCTFELIRQFEQIIVLIFFGKSSCAMPTSGS